MFTFPTQNANPHTRATEKEGRVTDLDVRQCLIKFSTEDRQFEDIV